MHVTEDQPKKPESAPIVTHMEHYLGPVTDGWKTTGEGEVLAFPLARFAPTPQAGWSVMATLGLSALSLTQPSGRGVRQELLVCWPDEAMDDAVPSHLYAMGKTVLATGEAISLGSVLPLPSEPELPSGHAQTWFAWYLTLPFFLPESAAICSTTEPATVLCWLVPIYEDEARFIDEHGGEAFEQMLLLDRAQCFQWPRHSFIGR